MPSAAPPPAAAIARAAAPQSGARPLGELSLAAKAAARIVPPSLASWLRVARQTEDDPTWPLTPSQRRMLLQLDPTARGAWQSVAQPAPAAGADVREMSWRNEAGQLSHLRVDGSGAHWTEPSGQTWFAPLDSAARNALLREF